MKIIRTYVNNFSIGSIQPNLLNSVYQEKYYFRLLFEVDNTSKDALVFRANLVRLTKKIIVFSVIKFERVDYYEGL
jgi:hypothetical protein